MAAAPIRRARSTGSSCAEGAELPQEPQVVLEEKAQVIHPVIEHCEPVDAGAEGVAGEALRIHTACPQHVRMHHAAAGHLEPAGVLAGAAAAPAAEHARHV